MENMRDQSHIKRYMASEIVQILQDAGLVVLDRVGECSDFDLEHWIGMADLPAGNVKGIREIMRMSMDWG